METRYNHKELEDKIYKTWEESGFFSPEGCIKAGITSPDAEYFSMVLPPPNVTGVLHMGHASTVAIEDIMIRYARMNGKRTLWIPGTDHAAIATQSRVEKDIAKATGKSRHDLGREEFLEKVNEFAKQSHDTIVNQVKRMGASLDWNREAFTLDEPRSLAVRTAFRNMYEDGLIYRGYRIINWDVKGQTAISDDEIVYEERDAVFYTFKYSKDFPISIGTTRPETKVGDTAVAVHPEDKRYQKFIGKTYKADFCGVSIEVKIVGDETVDPQFGTGALGVTPAHSTTDWEIAQRHKLEVKPVIDERGKMTVGETLKGKKTAEARELIVAWLKENGLLEKEEKIKQNISTSERTGAVIEPLPKLQWFIDVNKKFKLKKSEIEGIKSGASVTLKEIMKQTVENGQIKILPDRFEKVYFNWINNLRDWCISRQIWYGHRIPVWYCASCNTPKVNAEVKSKWFFVRHGETDWNRDKKMQGRRDIQLNETGKEQAKHVGKLLSNKNIDLVVSSTLLRAKETAEIIAAITKTNEILLDKDLQEKHYGQAEGMDHDEFKKLYRQESDIEAVPPDGESYEEVEKRAWSVMQDHKNKHSHKNVVIVAHGDVLRTLFKKIRGWSLSQMLANGALNNSGFIEFDVLDPCTKCGNHLFEQDPDTLDTWFSSGLWTFSTLGWPAAAEDFKNYHPTSVLETGYDILPFWVARMILMTGYNLGTIPFRKVYLHGMVRDEKGRKMSKSLGNGMDPLEMSDKYGADATRMSLIIGAAPGNDTRISEDRIKGYRNFSTKIWNAARFVLMNYEKADTTPKFTPSDNKNLKELIKIKKDVTTAIEAMDFNRAGETIYHYFWHTFADKIIEAAKPRLTANNDSDPADRAAAQETLMKILRESLKMLHPFMPFITEEIWSMIPRKAPPRGEPENKNLLIIEKWQ